MIIALDYDDTFTADKELWTGFVKEAKKNHEVTFVTFRREDDNLARGGNEDIIEDAEALGIQIVFTNGRQKSHVFKADIWIDDAPHLIVSYVNMASLVEGCKQMGDMN